MSRAGLISATILCALVVASASADGVWRRNDSAPGALLSADQAFDISAAERNGRTITVTWNIADGYYLYRKRLAFSVADVSDATLGTPVLPDGETIHDEEQGDLEIYRHTLVASLSLAVSTVPPRKLRVRYQGCAEEGVCYPPQTKIVDIVSTAR